MKRLTICIALLALMAWPLAADAGAKAKSPAVQTQLSAGSVTVGLTSPAGKVDTPYVLFNATVTDDTTAAVCVSNFLANLPLDCNLVSYVDFSVDGQFLVRDYEAPYSAGLQIPGGDGRHTAAVDVFRDLSADALTGPVSLGHATSAFCLNNCGT